MGKLTNALQGKLNVGQSPLKNSSGRQLDLFLSLADRGETTPRLASPSPASPEPKPEPEMILPPSRTPPDVSADVRAVLSDSFPGRFPEEAPGEEEGKRPLRTGIYRRPPRQRETPPPEAVDSAPAPRKKMEPGKWIREWFDGVELDRRLVSLVLVLVVLVAVVAFWSACPRGPEPGTTVDLREIRMEEEAVKAEPPAAPAAEIPPVPAPAPSAPAAPVPAPVPVPDWKIAGGEVTLAGGVYSIRFQDPVFVSADNISVEGMRALKSLGARLAARKEGARVVVTGHTDDVPLSKPTPKFRNNADLAEARAQAAMEHLASFARGNKALTFERRAGKTAEAPYPNDSDRNRRLNRTATVQVYPRDD